MPFFHADFLGEIVLQAGMKLSPQYLNIVM